MMAIKCSCSFILRKQQCHARCGGKKISQFIGVIKRMIAEEKQEMGAKNHEGKEKMNFDVYQVICKNNKRNDGIYFS